jgi:uridine kinase
MQVNTVGITGGSGSGKSRITQCLTQSITPSHCAVLHQDNYYRGLPLGVPIDEYNFDHPDAVDLDLLAQHIDRLRHCHPVDMPIYDFARHQRSSKTVRVVPAEVILVEGIYIAASEILWNMLDLSVFVHASDFSRCQRRLKRDVRERGRTEIDIMRQYQKQVLPAYIDYVQPAQTRCNLSVHSESPGDVPRAVDEILHALQAA